MKVLIGIAVLLRKWMKDGQLASAVFSHFEDEILLQQGAENRFGLGDGN